MPVETSPDAKDTEMKRKSRAESTLDLAVRPSRLRRRPRACIATLDGRASRLVSLAVGLALLVCCGCGPSPADAPSDAASGTPQSGVQTRAPAKQEAWYVCYLDGARVGYERTATTPFTDEGRRLLRIEGLSHMAVQRFGQEIAMDVRFTSVETPDGRLLRFEAEFSQGPVPMRVTGGVAGDKLQIETTTKGKTVTTSIPWSAEYGGFSATEQSLKRKPMKPGERRTIHALFPGFNVVATRELVARDYEPVKLLAGTYELLRIDTAATLPEGMTMQGNIWTDREGEALKSRLEMMTMGIELYRATKAEALAETQPARFDLGLDVAVPADRPIPSPHETRQVRYRVSLEGGDPAAAFVSGASQRVQSTGPHTAEVTVWAIRPDGPPGNPDAPDDPPSDDDRKSNNLIQSDYPAIVSKAREVADKETEPWQAAVALEQAVHNTITLKGYSQALATAAEVIDSGEGDCTEHAMLLAALARARGIPARVAIGLVYKDQAFYYHMWTEMHVGDQWIPLDATLGQGGIGAAHLKMAHSSLKGSSALSSLLPVLQVIGRLKIEILEVE